jgi:hypothetical protein
MIVCNILQGCAIIYLIIFNDKQLACFQYSAVMTNLALNIVYGSQGPSREQMAHLADELRNIYKRTIYRRADRVY